MMNSRKRKEIQERDIWQPLFNKNLGNQKIQKSFNLY